MKRLRIYHIGFAVLSAVAFSLPASAQFTEAPKYGGTIELSTIYPTRSAMTFDAFDWAWKFNHDTGAVYDFLLGGDIAKARSRGGNYGFAPDGYLPPHAIRNELA